MDPYFQPFTSIEPQPFTQMLPYMISQSEFNDKTGHLISKRIRQSSKNGDYKDRILQKSISK
jgi:hypothetical protein